MAAKGGAIYVGWQTRLQIYESKLLNGLAPSAGGLIATAKEVEVFISGSHLENATAGTNGGGISLGEQGRETRHCP